MSLGGLSPSVTPGLAGPPTLPEKGREKGIRPDPFLRWLLGVQGRSKRRKWELRSRGRIPRKEVFILIGEKRYKEGKVDRNNRNSRSGFHQSPHRKRTFR